MLTSKNFWLGGAEVVEGYQVVEHGQLGEIDAVVVGVEEDSLGCAMLSDLGCRSKDATLLMNNESLYQATGSDRRPRPLPTVAVG